MNERLNSLVYALRRQAWLAHLPRLLGPPRPSPVAPIFLLGVQGGGLTLASRMLRRNRNVVCVTGNHRYWAGADELQNVLHPILPAAFKGLAGAVPPDEFFPNARGSSYATDRLLPQYRQTDADASPELRKAFRGIVGWLIRMHGRRVAEPRFIDKSQTFTVRLGLLRSIFDDAHFVLIGRDPHASSLRSLRLAEYRDDLPSHFTRHERLEMAAQHWANSMSCAIEDARGYERFHTLKFEDLLAQPEVEMARLCGLLGLEFDPDMVPAAHHRLPLGSRMRDRWYPMRPEVNERYLAEETAEEAAIIERICGPMARELGYAAR
ncbi:MAG: sulfotransferase [Proteobacteria bacterium]|nr:sulfotransferase [Pseudomonadota bacterium]